MTRLGGLAVMLVAALLAGCQAQPTTSPSLSGDAPTAQASPTPVPDPGTPPPSGVINVFDVVLSDGQYSVPVTFLDRVGIVTGIQDAGNNGPFAEGVSSPPPGVDGFVFTWVGGACDIRTTIELTVDAAGTLTLHSGQQLEPGPCIMIGIGRHLLIRTDTPVEPDAIVVR